MIRLPTFVALLMAMVLALSSVSLAAMGHGTASTGGTMLVTLCGSDTPVLVDLPGSPASSPRPVCPDCLLHAGLALLTACDLPLLPPPSQRILARSVRSPGALPLALVPPQARAPPVLI